MNCKFACPYRIDWVFPYHIYLSEDQVSFPPGEKHLKRYFIRVSKTKAQILRKYFLHYISFKSKIIFMKKALTMRQNIHIEPTFCKKDFFN